MKLIIQDNIGSLSAGEVAISTNEMKELVSWLESRGCDVGATQQSVQADLLQRCANCGEEKNLVVCRACLNELVASR